MPEATVVIYKALAPELCARLEARYEVLDFSGRENLAQDAEFARAIQRADGVLGASVALGRELLAPATRLRVISSVSVGVDKYDLDYLAARGITLCHTPGVLTETVADTAFLLILATARRAMELSRMVRDGRWQHSVGPALYGRDVHHKRLGIVGMGRIGAAIARRAAHGFSMSVRYHNRSGHAPIDNELGASWQPLDTLLAESDIVCATVPLSPATHRMFGAEQFKRMGSDTFFVNIGRGGVVDERAMVNALENGTIRAAGLDVFEKEPLPIDSPLLSLSNVVTLPHIGSATWETRTAMAAMAVDNLIAALEGNEPPAAYQLR